jgi:hypothetical protein
MTYKRGRSSSSILTYPPSRHRSSLTQPNKAKVYIHYCRAFWHWPYMANIHLLQQFFQLVITIFLVLIVRHIIAKHLNTVRRIKAAFVITATIVGISSLVYIVIANMLESAGLQGQLELQNNRIARWVDKAQTQGWNACKDVCKHTCRDTIQRSYRPFWLPRL